MHVMYGHLPNTTLTDAISVLGSTENNFNWLFVTIDSLREEELAAAISTICSELKAIGVSCKEGKDGIVVDGQDVSKVTNQTSIIVPFSAAYIVGSDLATGFKNTPSYNFTSESEQFSLEHPPSKGMIEELIRFQALGYLADGCGLNYVSIHPELSRQLLKFEEVAV